MKRMSEVFELPVDQKKLELYGYEAGEMQDVPYHVAEEHAAHAINHVDALADALEEATALLYFQYDLHYGRGIDDPVIKKLYSALKAYRGEK